MVFENNGSRNPARTYQDLLKSAHDGDVFEYFNTHRLKVVNTEGLLQSEPSSSFPTVGIGEEHGDLYSYVRG